MLEPRIDLVALQACLLRQLFEEVERKWIVENEKKNSNGDKCAACEASRAERSPKSNAPARHWPPHRRFWHCSPRKWREANVEAEKVES